MKGHDRAEVRRVLLSDGSGLASRQTATCLGLLGHEVEVLNPAGFSLMKFTRWVRKVHTVPRFGADPLAWLEAALLVLAEGSFDLFLPTQEQVTVLAAHVERVRALGVGIAVPPFAALERVQDKVSAIRTLEEAGLPQPAGTVAHTPEELLGARTPPAFVKASVGTASTGVCFVGDDADLRAAAQVMAEAGAFEFGGVVVQQPLAGPLAMVQSVFSHGRLIAWHANLRVREGMGGGASSKRSLDLPVVGTHLALLGAHLGWHGALSMDAILTSDGPSYIDVNPRLVEPMNARLAGVDLVGSLMRVSAGQESPVLPPGRPGVLTHQLILALTAAASARGRRGVLRELSASVRRSGAYRSSSEELTPLRGDPRSAIPVALITLALLAQPASAARLSTGAVANYSIDGRGWQRIRDGHRLRLGSAPRDDNAAPHEGPLGRP